MSETLKNILVDQYASLTINANALGELLRSWAFIGDGYGCYSTFDLRPEFVEVEASPREFEILWGRPYDPADIDPDEYFGYCDTKAIKRISWYKHPNGIEVGWYWDGDGTLGFYIPELNNSVTNHDCKKSDEWEFNE